MRLITWNVNGIRARLEGLERVVATWSPDVLALQEVKAAEEQFPFDAVERLGYGHVALTVQKGYHGVAILSRLPFREVRRRVWAERPQARHLSVRLVGGPELHSVYIPKGGHVPDPAESDDFAYKLAYLRAMQAWFQANRTPRQRLIMVGDFNVAPLPTDVWNHKRLVRSVGHSPREVEHLEALQGGLGWVDAVRQTVPPDQPVYSWWGYRVPNSYEKGYGWRLDHIWLTPGQSRRLKECRILADVRTWPRPSDHVPVLADFRD